MITIPVIPLIAFVILIASVVALSTSKSRTLDTVMFLVFYAAAVVAVASTGVALLSGLS